MKATRTAILLLLALVAAQPRAFAKDAERQDGPSALPPAARAVDIDEHMGQPIDDSLSFVDQNGRTVKLGDYLHKEPLVLVLAYYRCPMLCDLVLRGLVSGMKDLSLRLGQDYHALTVSFDPRDTPSAAARKQKNALMVLDMPDKAGAFPFLVGEASQSHALADELGFRYAYDPRTGEYAHPAVLVVLTPDGRISRYLYGVDVSPRDLRLALVEAGRGQIGNIVDRVLLTCYHFDPATRRYGPFIAGFLRIGALFILTVVGILLFALFRKERARAAREGGHQS